MSYKCKLCGKNDVEKPGEICASCSALTNKPQTILNTEKEYLDIDAETDSSDWEPLDPFAFDQVEESLPKVSAESKVLTDETPLQNSQSKTSSNQFQNNSSENVSPKTYSTEKNFDSYTSILNKGECKTRGYVKNVRYSADKSKGLERWFNAFIDGTPYSRNEFTTAFQVFPDFTGTSYNSSGTICDQVIFWRIL